jgi:hypothetical protein
MTWDNAADLRSALTQAHDFLRSVQRPDGGFGWPEIPTSDAWSTSECVLALSIPAVTDAAERGLAWLRANVRDDGGWASEAYRNVTGGNSDVSGTSYAMRALACCGSPGDRPLIEAGRVWLVNHQRPDGSWGVAEPDEGKGFVGQTGYAISALARAPAEHRAAEALQAALYYLYSTQRPAGGWALTPGHEIDPTLTAYALRGIIDAAALRGQPARPRIFLRWLANIQQTQDANGSWSDWYGNRFSVEATGYVVELGSCLGFALEPDGSYRPWLRRALAFLEASRQPNGGWGITLGEAASHWVTHSIVIALAALVGEATHVAARFDVLATSTGSDGPAPAGELGTPYDFAVSFASSQRDYARALAIKLQQRGASVFFDEFESDKLWGANLIDRFTHVYREGSRLCIMIISEDYVKRAWPKLERQSAQARALAADQDFILPIRIGHYTVIPGLLDTVGYLDGDEYDVDEIAALAMAKLERLPV